MMWAVAFVARFRFVRGADGVVGAEIITPERLGPEPFFDQGVLDPSVYIPKIGISLTCFFDDARNKRYPGVQVGAPHDGRWHDIVDRPLDLSEGSEERMLTAALLEQEWLPVLWVNEGISVSTYIYPGRREQWGEILDQTRGVTLQQWLDGLLLLGADFSEWPGGVRPTRRRRKRRSASAPERPVPFFAARSGAIPRAGHASLAGIRLPRGSRMPSLAPAYWISNTPVAGIVELAGRLARAFPDTGVWPLLWMYPDDPDVYMPQGGDPDLIDAISVETELARHWARLGGHEADAAPYFGGQRPVLADPSPAVAAEQARPFDRLPTGTEARLLLVPCNRPADAITVIGGLACELPAPDISALIRSWEERFAAILVAAAPRIAWLAVESPPRERDQALALAAELNVGCRLPDAYNDATLPQIATALIADPTTHSPAATVFDLRPDLWPLAWWE